MFDWLMRTPSGAVWLSIFSTVLGLSAQALPAAEAPGKLRCENLFEKLLPHARIEKADHLDPQLYEAHYSLFPDLIDAPIGAWTRARVYDAAYLPKFINTRVARSAPVVGPFVADYTEQRPYWDTTRPINRDIRSGAYWEYRRQPHFELFIWRGRGDEPILPNYVPVSSYVPGRLAGGWEQTLINVKSAIRNSLERLYQSYRSQGPERSSVVPIVREQDQKDFDRTTHFEIGHFKRSPEGELLSEGAGHLQMLVSRNASERLHVEDQWGPLERKPGEVIGDLGRYYFEKEDVQIGKRKLNRDQKTLLRMILWQKMFAWACHDVKIDRMVFQVNERVRGVLIGYGLPLEEAKARRVSQRINGEDVSEWVFELDYKVMLEAEKRLMARVIAKQIEPFLAEEVARRIKEDSILKMKFSRNEIPSLIALGLMKPTPTLKDIVQVELTLPIKMAEATLHDLKAMMQ